MMRRLLHIAIVMVFYVGVVTGAQAVAPGVALVAAVDVHTEKTSDGVPTALLKPIYVQSNQYGTSNNRQQHRMIPPSAALRAALGYAPGSQGLGVRLLQGPHLVYAVKVKSGNRIRRILVDAQTGRILGE